MEQYGNQGTYNVESVLHKNITGCEYYNKTCAKLENWSQVVDEIYDSVADVEPWMSGNARGASTAFCLLFRFPLIFHACILDPHPPPIPAMIVLLEPLLVCHL